MDTAVKTAETGYMQRRLVKVSCTVSDFFGREYDFNNVKWQFCIKVFGKKGRMLPINSYLPSLKTVK